MTRSDEPLPNWMIEEIKAKKLASGPHVPIDELDDYLEDRVEAGRQVEIREHLVWCRTCFERVRVLSDPDLIGDTEKTPPVESQRFRPIDPRFFLVAALFLACFSLWLFFRSEKPTGATGFDLVPTYQTRSQETIQINLTDTWLALRLNGIPLIADKPLRAILFRQHSGVVVLEQPLAEPGPEGVYHLLIPPHYLEPRTTYQLEIHDPNQADGPVTTYFFQTEP